MTDTTNVTHMPARPARRRKSTGTPAAAPLPVTTLAPPMGDGIALALGTLTGVVAGIQEAVTDLKTDVRDERDASSESRRRMHESISELKDRVHAIDRKVSRVLDVDARLGAVDVRLGAVEAEAAKTRRIRELAAQLFSRGWKFGVGALGLTGVGAVAWFWKQLGVFVDRVSSFFS